MPVTINAPGYWDTILEPYVNNEQNRGEVPLVPPSKNPYGTGPNTGPMIPGQKPILDAQKSHDEILETLMWMEKNFGPRTSRGPLYYKKEN